MKDITMRNNYCSECDSNNCTCQDDTAKLEDGIDLLSQSEDDTDDIPDRQMITNQNPLEEDV